MCESSEYKMAILRYESAQQIIGSLLVCLENIDEETHKDQDRDDEAIERWQEFVDIHVRELAIV